MKDSKHRKRAGKPEHGPSASPPVEANRPEHDRRGKTACDEDCSGEGEEGFTAEDYPGHNPLSGEDAAEHRARTAPELGHPAPQDGKQER
jgi:hypothetical protein